ncbi:helix-turn-helix domain-containing protein [Nonomuraea recticatena]|uniref:Helix-turn-helix domain-containing protein n=1 Tax=Nonomuraea recticatena TaxID=46178 RepID=A0ABN3T206_9ACTN
MTGMTSMSSVNELITAKDALTSIATLADQLGQAARNAAHGLAAIPPADTATRTGIQTELNPLTAEQRIHRAPTQIANDSEHIYNQINSAGAAGTTVSDLAAITGHNAYRTRRALQDLEAAHRIFRTTTSGSPTHRWYSDSNRTALINTMRRRVPTHDLTVSEAAAILNVPEQRIRDMIKAKQLAGRTVGRAFIIHRKALLDHIQAIGTPAQ